jgi:glutamine amidotransferase
VIAVLDYGIGNLRSAEKALQHVGADANLIDDPDALDSVDGVVLPGVGAFGACAEALARSGLWPPAAEAIERGVPFLGICVGFQLLYEGSDEDPATPGLALFDGTVRRLPEGVKHPQMQWNRLDLRPGQEPCGMFEGLGPEPWLYFVHSFAPPIGAETAGTCDYGGTIAAAAAAGPVWGTQFHPEKSGSAGLRILANFVARCAPADAAEPR